jgi:oxalate decarboxylase
MSDHELADLPSGSSRAGGVFSRRRLLGTTTLAVAGAALAAGREAHAQSPQNVRSAEHGASASNPGPENEALKTLNPNSYLPPPTDHGDPQTFWSSFSLMHRRIQDGGWTRQVNVRDFPISTPIAGVNMRLTAGGIRELHWHKANEWALMLNGNCRLTALNFDGSTFVGDGQRATSGTSRPACRTRCKGSARTAANSCSYSTTAISPRTTPRSCPIG